MLDGKKSQVSRSSVINRASSVKQQQVRMSDPQEDELVERCRQSAFKKELARAYGIHVETVRANSRRSLQPG